MVNVFSSRKAEESIRISIQLQITCADQRICNSLRAGSASDSVEVQYEIGFRSGLFLAADRLGLPPASFEYIQWTTDNFENYSQ